MTHPAADRAGSVHTIAIAMVIGGAMVNSTGGLLVRHIETAGEWQMVFWRAIALAIATSVILAVEHRGGTLAELRRVGVKAPLGGLFYAGTLIGYVLALNHTTVANADFTMSAIPIFTALMAWLLLGERVGWRTALAIAAAFAGIAVMLGDGIGRGSIAGNLMAMGAAASFACFVVVLRHGRSVSMLPAIVAGALIAAAAAALLTDGDLEIPAHDLALCLIWGGVTSSIAHGLIVTAGRFLAGAELTLLMLLEFILGTTWVWLVVNETPGPLTLVGGAIVLTAVATHTLLALTRPAPAKP